MGFRDKFATTAPVDTPAGLERIVPQLADLLAQNRRASALPSWTRAIRARQRGDYRAPLKGRGMEYAESRPYQAGDDIRAIDWRLTARSGKPHTKLFREERERPVYVCVDARAGMAFATRGVFKRVLAARIAALLAWHAVQGGDRIGGVVFSDTTHTELEPERGNLAAMRLFKALIAVESGTAAPNGHQPAAAAIRRLRRLVKPGSLVFIVSDGRDFDAGCLADLASMARHNDVGVILVYDEFERTLPLVNHALKLTNGPAELALPATDATTQTAYAARFAARQTMLAKSCRDHHILFTSVATAADPLPVLQRFFGAR